MTTVADVAPMNGSSYNDIQAVDQPSSQATERHEGFYISDGEGMSIFLVERTLYKVHRYFLARESSVFRTMFDCPHPVEGQDGESDKNPIYLHGVSCSEFEALLDFFYNGMFNHGRKKGSECNVLIDNILTDNVPIGNERKALYDLLSISLLYEFDRVIKEVVAQIDDCKDDNTDLVAKICLGLAHHDYLRHWVPPAFDALIERDYFLTRDEINQLGAGRTSIVGTMREKGREKRSPNGYGWIRSAWEVPPEFYSA